MNGGDIVPRVCLRLSDFSRLTCSPVRTSVAQSTVPYLKSCDYGTLHTKADTELGQHEAFLDVPKEMKMDYCTVILRDDV
ncbi:hypothetical protein E5676_scaffold113G001480 [Cucumis melo var. makuwa]|uniref:Uncharacterized protein n=2 Tax=Cucumis melo TaxID=3656 RepID=A0A5A7UF24_CUCMM|nr:hypothetical protein [Cucumis melo subsp. melo]KAA0052325.1 hypothetical protein E6C27_scaffold207G001620 [Cucumis melo var. makuwa]TYK01885.1 hypothetical protein E5676_scaffold113G001480 [Cucumis melo var. makuwa]